MGLGSLLGLSGCKEASLSRSRPTPKPKPEPHTKCPEHKIELQIVPGTSSTEGACQSDDKDVHCLFALGGHTSLTARQYQNIRGLPFVTNLPDINILPAGYISATCSITPSGTGYYADCHWFGKLAATFDKPTDACTKWCQSVAQNFINTGQLHAEWYSTL